MIPAGYDVIGDVHGHANALERLLAILGYERRHSAAWGHSERLALFVGDFVDRGRENIRACHIVMDMTAAGTALAVMGNHEFNAIAMATCDPDRPGDYLRVHSEKNRRQTETTRAEFERHPDDARSILAWMKTLPLWRDAPEYRLVHADWDVTAQIAMGPHLDATGALTETGFILAARRGDAAYDAREILLNGIEASLPGGQSFINRDRESRKDVRLAWWRAGEEGLTWRTAAVAPPDVIERLPDTPLCQEARARLGVKDEDGRPVFFGHYWMTEPLAPQTSRHFCLDASVARSGGRLAALRYSAGQPLSSAELVYVSP
jgi:hypothetical protein